MRLSEGDRAAIEQLVLSLASPPPAQLREFLDQGRAITVSKGAFLCAPGETEHQLGFVHEGLLRYHVVTAEGLDATKDFAVPGSFAGSFGSAIRGAPAEVSVSAVESSRLTVWPFSSVRSLYAKHLEWERLGRRVAEMLYLRKERREIDFLLLDASGRCEAARRELGESFARIPRHLLASYLGIAPESLSRLRARTLRRRG